MSSRRASSNISLSCGAKRDGLLRTNASSRPGSIFMGNTIASLLTRDRIVAGESQARFAGDKHFMQCAERRKAHARLTDRQPGAKHRVKLPACNQAYAAGGQIDMRDDVDAAALE